MRQLAGGDLKQHVAPEEGREYSVLGPLVPFELRVLQSQGKNFTKVSKPTLFTKINKMVNPYIH